MISTIAKGTGFERHYRVMIDPLLLRAQGNIIFSVFRMFANVRARVPRYQKWKRGKNPERGAKGATVVVAIAREEGRREREREEKAGELAPPSRCYAENSRDSR